MRWTEEELIAEAIKGNGAAQNEIYNRFAPKLWGICLRYAKNQMAAEDIMQEGFIRIFTYLDKFKGQGSFEGWMRRTMVNTAINHYRKNLKASQETIFNDVIAISANEEDAVSKLTSEEIMKLVNDMPDGYRTVFNMYIVEGYSHREIAEKLNISENTSKSQLSRARTLLQVKVNKLFKKL